jgi:hypothetical protein
MLPLYCASLFKQNILEYEMDQRNKTHRLVHSLKCIICKLNNKCNTYTSPLDHTQENKLKATDTTLASP